MNTWKAIQRKLYDILSHKYSLLLLIPCLVLTLLLLSLIQVGEAWNYWLEKGEGGRFPSNLGSSCHQETEIDAVYTWVNGSDPLLIEELKYYRDESQDIQRWSECPHPDCEPSHIVLYRGCDKFSEKILNPILSLNKVMEVPNLANLVTSACVNDTSSLIYLSSIEDASKVVQLKNINGSFSQAFWTTELSASGNHPAPEWIRLSGVLPKFLNLPIDSMKKFLSKQIHSPVDEIWPASSKSDQSFVILKLQNSQDVDQVLLKSRVISLAGDLVVLSRVALVFNVPLKNRFDHYAPSRFEDKEELRYSLRSLEKHAPWIRHVYLVTNGQIPHWLDLDNPRLTLVTHKDIFPNQSHLPTFSSPAIESHLHRIEGISSKFIYLNDDVMFTQNVWPEDFYTNSRGYKVYLSWPVPDCSPTCLWSWVGDGSCDSECNVMECGFDGGDCNETDGSSSSLKIHMPREQFSAYDDLYDLGFGNVDDTMENVEDVNLNHLQAPGLDPDENGLKTRLEKLARETEQDDDYLVSLQRPIENHKNAQDARRHKRAVIKKNLASRSYHGSSMIAGRSADFPGSVTNSEIAPNQAMIAVSKLEKGERHQHRSPFPQVEYNKTIIPRGMNNGERGRLVLGYLQTSNNRTNSSHDVHGKPRIRESSKIKVQHKNSVMQGNESEAFRLKMQPTKENIHNMNDSLLEGRKHRADSFHPTKAKQRNHRLMAHELNESLNLTMIHKEQHRQVWYGNSKHRILDSFAESLLHVNMLFNKVYGFETRRVPAHAPHLIEKHIMRELQEKFPKEWEDTSSHKLRSPVDMQFAFSYFYYLMSEEVDVTVKKLFEIHDTDHTGTWSDREIRTLMTRLYPAPLNPRHLLQFEEFVLSCARSMVLTDTPSASVSTPMYERYQDSPLPTVTWDLVNNCPELKKLMMTNLGKRKKYSYEIVRDWSKDVTFKMLHSNVSHLVGHLDDIRRNPKKFICLNDNLDPKQESENDMVRAVLRDFFHSFFPLPSKFELPSDMRNRFLHVSALEKWKGSRARLRIAAILAVVTLCLLTFAVICPDEGRHYGRRILERAFCLQRRGACRIRSKSRSPVLLSSGSRSV